MCQNPATQQHEHTRHDKEEAEARTEEKAGRVGTDEKPKKKKKKQGKQQKTTT